MKKRLLICLLVLLAYPASLLAQHTVSFFEEHIDFKLDSSHFTINGIYSFYNNSQNSVSQQIVFPFAATTKTIDSIKVLDLNAQRLLPYTLMASAVAFIITIPPKDTLDVNIFYRQKSAIKNTYILTSTQSWGKPLDRAFYTLLTSTERAIDSFSYDPDTVKVVGNHKLYQWEKHHFLPQYNFEVTIK